MIWTPNLLGFLVMLFGLFFTGLEVWGTCDFLLKDQAGLNYIVLAGCGVAAASATLPPIGDLARRKKWRGLAALAYLAVPLTLVVIIVAGVQRTGTATDAAQGGRDLDERNLQLARAAEKEALADLETDKATAKAECATGFGLKCDKARAAQAATQRRLDEARAQIRAVPVKQTDAASTRIAALSFGYVTDLQVRLYQPLFVPFLVSILAALFLMIGVRLTFQVAGSDAEYGQARTGHPKVATGQKPVALAEMGSKSESQPVASNVVVMQPKHVREVDARPVIKFMSKCVPAVKGEMADWADLYTTFCRWHAQQDADAQRYTVGEFGAIMAAICSRADIPVIEKGERVYCVDRLISG